MTGDGTSTGATGPQVSPLAPAAFPDLPSIPGVRFAAAAAGIKAPGRVDVMLAEIAAGSTITKDVADGELAIGRSRQANKPGWAGRTG